MSLPTRKEMEAAIEKPGSGLLLVELDQETADELQAWIGKLTFGDLVNATERVPLGLRQVWTSLTSRVKT